MCRVKLANLLVGHLRDRAGDGPSQSTENTQPFRFRDWIFAQSGHLEGFAEISSSFGKCTACHVRKPGSTKLTRQGKRFQWMIEDMEGLRDLVLSEHPELVVPGSGEAAESDSEVARASSSEPPD